MGNDVGPPEISQVGSQASGLMADESSLLSPALSAQQTYAPGFTGTTLSQILQAAGGAGGLGASFSSALPWLAGGINTANQAQAGGNVNTVSALGPGAAGAVSAVNPAQSNQLSQLLQTTATNLGAGTQLTPEATSNINNSVLGNWANRGLGGTDPAMLDQALNLYGGGQNQLLQNEGASSSALNLSNMLTTNPALSLITGSSAAPGLAENTIGQGLAIAGPSGPTLTDPENTLNTAYNSIAASNIQTGNNKAATLSGLLSMFGGLLGGGGGGGGGGSSGLSSLLSLFSGAGA
jgi:hypothetical protein